MTSAAFLAPSSSLSSSPRLSFARRWWREPPLNLIHDRLRHVRGIVKSVIPSLSPPPPPQATTTCAFFCSTGSTDPRPQPPFFPDLLSAILKVSAASFLALPLPTLSPSPSGGNSFRELCGKFPLLPLLRPSRPRHSSNSRVSWSFHFLWIRGIRRYRSVNFVYSILFFYPSLDGQTLARSILFEWNLSRGFFSDFYVQGEGDLLVCLGRVLYL